MISSAVPGRRRLAPGAIVDVARLAAETLMPAPTPVFPGPTMVWVCLREVPLSGWKGEGTGGGEEGGGDLDGDEGLGADACRLSLCLRGCVMGFGVVSKTDVLAGGGE